MIEMKRITATVKGKIQRVGYRDWVDEIASSSGIKGFVENSGDEINLLELLLKVKPRI
jgi:acylphosphatase